MSFHDGLRPAPGFLGAGVTGWAAGFVIGAVAGVTAGGVTDVAGLPVP